MNDEQLSREVAEKVMKWDETQDFFRDGEKLWYKDLKYAQSEDASYHEWWNILNPSHSDMIVDKMMEKGYFFTAGGGPKGRDVNRFTWMFHKNDDGWRGEDDNKHRAIALAALTAVEGQE